MLRTKGVLALLVVVGLFVLLAFFLTDRWLEARLENLGQAVVGAKVEIDNLNVSFTEVQVSWDRLQVTDPQKTMQNMLETGLCRFDLEFWPLLSGKIIIEDFRIENLRTGTERETDGRLPQPEEKEPGYMDRFIASTIEKMNERVANELPVHSFDFKRDINVDSLMQVLDLQSPKRMEALQKELNNKYSEWQKRLAALTFEQDLKNIEQQARAIKPDQIKTLDQIRKTIVRVNEIKTSLDKINRQINEAGKAFDEDLARTRERLGQVDDWIAQDYASAMAMAKLPDFSLQNIAGMLFGRQVVSRVAQYLSYLGTARYYAAMLHSDKPQKEKPPRLKGQDIHFYNKNARPDLWIKKILLSGQTHDGLPLQGEVQHISSDQRLVNQPTTIVLEGGGQKGITFRFDGTLDYRQAIPEETFRLNYAGFSLNGTRLSDSPLLPQTIRSGSGSLSARLALKGAQLSAQVGFTGQQIVFDFAAQKPKSRLEKLLQETLNGIRTIDFSVKITADSSNLRFSVHSSLDKILAERLKGTVSRELEKAKQQLKERIEREISPYKEKLLRLAADNEKAIRSQVAEYEKRLAAEKEKINEQLKAVEKKINEEKSKLEKDVSKKIMDLFK